MNNIKLIALDLDGTLFNKDGIISTANKEQLNRAAAQGIKIVISTGRPFNGLPFEQIKDKSNGIILSNEETTTYSDRIDDIISNKDKYKKAVKNFKYN